jgi:hypothetical protein
MTTVRDLIVNAFREAGILGLGQTLSGEDLRIGHQRLQWMLAEWQKQRLLVYSRKAQARSVTGESYFSIGPGGRFSTPTRPNKLYFAYFRSGVTDGDFSEDFDDDFEFASISATTDTPIRLLPSLEDFSAVTSKYTPGEPVLGYYEASFPQGKLHVSPVPAVNTGQVIIVFPAVLQDLSSINTDVNLPAEYEPALHYNLAKRLVLTYRKPLRPDLENFATTAMETIKQGATEVPLLSMPSGLPGLRRGISCR